MTEIADQLRVAASIAVRDAGHGSSELADSLQWLSLSQTEQQGRVTDFEWANGRLNQLMEMTQQVPSMFDAKYTHIRTLAKLLNGSPIPSLGDIQYDLELPDTANMVRDTIQEAAASHPEWAVESHSTDTKGTPASGSLIEGFAAFLARNEGGNIPDLARTYVLAVESLLLIEKPESPLLRDVVGWMKDELSSFPKPLQPIIESIT